MPLRLAFLYEGRVDGGRIDPNQILKGFIDRTDRVLQLVEGFVPEAAWLSDAETLTYLHSIPGRFSTCRTASWLS